MKKYILTENQLNFLLLENEKPIKKGFALKISDENGEYYKSVMKEFVNESDYNDWKESLETGIEIIGEMDIEEETKENIQESKKKTTQKDKGFTLLTKILKKKYPYIINITPIESDLKKYGILIGIKVNFDLNQFYHITNTTPPESYYKLRFLFDTLKQSYMYLFPYVDDKYRDDFRSEFNQKFEKEINDYYSKLPDYLTINQYENLDDDEIKERFADSFFDFDTIKNFRDIEKKPVKLKLDKWLPNLDIDELK